VFRSGAEIQRSRVGVSTSGRDCERGRTAEQQRIAVRFRAGHELGPERAAGAGPIIDHDCSEARRQLLRNQSAYNVGRSAGRKWDCEPYPTGWIRLRIQRNDRLNPRTLLELPGIHADESPLASPAAACSRLDVMLARETVWCMLLGVPWKGCDQACACTADHLDRGSDPNCRPARSCRPAAAGVDPLGWRIWRFSQHSMAGRRWEVPSAISERNILSISVPLIPTFVRACAAKGCERHNLDTRCRA
jgi:hypothetical protein